MPLHGADVSGAVALVTGGSGGIGAGVARRLAAGGASVVIADVDETGGQSVAEEIGGTFVRCDVSQLADDEAAVAVAVERHGGLDIAFLNAGVSTGFGVGADFDLERYRRVMGINLDGVVFGVHAALPALRARGGGLIVATASLAGLTAMPMDPVYGANKHAVVGLVRALGPALAREGIRVQGLCPSFAQTAIIAGLEEVFAASGTPVLSVEEVVDGFMAAAASDGSGECFHVVPGRALEPFRFRGVPGPRDAVGQTTGALTPELQVAEAITVGGLPA